MEPGLRRILGNSVVQRIQLFKFAITQDGRIARGTCPVLPEEDGAPGQLGLFRVALELFVASRWKLWKSYPAYLTNQMEQAGNIGLFTKLYKLRITEAFYDAVEGRDSPPGKEWKTEEDVPYLGSSSFVESYSLRESEQGSILASLDKLLVHVNLSTRRPDPIPKSITERFSGVLQSQKPSMFKLDFDAPEKVPLFSTSEIMTEDSLDVNGHINIHVYQWVMLQCVEDALRNGVFPNCSGQYRVKEFRTVFLSEATAGDTLKADVWEVEENRVRMLLSRGSERLVLGSIDFHPLDHQNASARL